MEKNVRSTRHYTCTCHFSVYKVSASTSSRKFSGLVQKIFWWVLKIFWWVQKIFWWVQKNFPKLFFKKCLECSDSSKKLKFLRIQTFPHTKWVKILKNNSSYWACHFQWNSWKLGTSIIQVIARVKITSKLSLQQNALFIRNDQKIRKSILLML